MKIFFKKLNINGKVVNISFNKGFSFIEYPIEAAKNDGIHIPDTCYDFDNIIIKGEKLEVSELRYQVDFSNYKKENLDFRVRRVTILNNSNSIEDEAFDSSYIEDIEIPDGIISIGKKAFHDCSCLKKIYIPDSVTFIGDFAFTLCTCLKNIEIPDSVTYIGKYAFEGCSNLDSIKISNSLVSISEYAFTRNRCTTIEIPNSVISIERGAFQTCTLLKTIIIPTSVTHIGSYILANCYEFETINYKGTEEQWNDIIKDPGWNSTSSRYKLKINYNYEN